MYDDFGSDRVLDMSVRQTQRLLTRYRDGGGGALIGVTTPNVKNRTLAIAE